MRLHVWFLCIALLLPLVGSAEEKNPQAAAMYRQGIAYKRQGELDQAIVALEGCLKLDPSHGLAMFSLGTIWKKKGDLVQAQKYFVDATKAEPTYGPAFLSLGQLLLRDGKLAEARTSFESAVRGKDISQDDIAEAWNGIAVSWRYESKWAEAIKAYDEAIAIAPKNWSYYNNKGISQSKSGKEGLAAAETTIRKAIELAPNEFDPWNTLGIILRKLGKVNDAISAYEKALSLDAKATDTWFDIASMYLKAEKFPKALEAFETYLKLSGDGPNKALVEEYIKQLKEKLEAEKK